ncbi:MAG TPA: TetR/AcrR family transcriptional regulator C-terminal domain-containing protein [Candidatus Ventrimonas merdavium]|nr:TetR/AcrR family transcriptional regulator C-terminal domain-containing protein [Candidatus Ventrimonas merdavium]
MEIANMDRRVRRTRRLLKDSLIALMQEKEFMDISVKEITDRADLNRGTFYLHYPDIYHLLRDIEDEALTDFHEMLMRYRESPDKDSLRPMLDPMIDYVGGHADICRILFQNSATIEFLNRFHQQIHETGREIIEALFPDMEDTLFDYFLEYITSGLTGLMAQWLRSGQALPKEQLAEIADQAMLGTARGMLRTTEKSGD